MRKSQTTETECPGKKQHVESLGDSSGMPGTQDGRATHTTSKVRLPSINETPSKKHPYKYIETPRKASDQQRHSHTAFVRRTAAASCLKHPDRGCRALILGPRSWWPKENCRESEVGQWGLDLRKDTQEYIAAVCGVKRPVMRLTAV